MLIGHYGPALALKAARPSLSLGLLFVAVQLVDFGWAAFVLTGVERARSVEGFTASNTLALDYVPWSHSLVATVVWASVFAIAAVLLKRLPVGDRLPSGLALAAAVASHWFCDLPMHVPDLPLFMDDGVKLGFGLWNHRAASFAFELVVFAAGASLYLRRVQPAGSHRRRMFGLFAFMAVLNGSNYFGPHPPTIEGIAAGALLLYVTLAGLAWFVDRPRPLPSAESTAIAPRE